MDFEPVASKGVPLTSRTDARPAVLVAVVTATW